MIIVRKLLCFYDCCIGLDYCNRCFILCLMYQALYEQVVLLFSSFSVLFELS